MGWHGLSRSADSQTVSHIITSSHSIVGSRKKVANSRSDGSLHSVHKNWDCSFWWQPLCRNDPGTSTPVIQWRPLSGWGMFQLVLWMLYTYFPGALASINASFSVSDQWTVWNVLSESLKAGTKKWKKRKKTPTKGCDELERISFEYSTVPSF